MLMGKMTMSDIGGPHSTAVVLLAEALTTPFDGLVTDSFGPALLSSISNDQSIICGLRKKVPRRFLPFGVF